MHLQETSAVGFEHKVEEFLAKDTLGDVKCNQSADRIKTENLALFIYLSTYLSIGLKSLPCFPWFPLSTWFS